MLSEILSRTPKGHTVTVRVNNLTFVLSAYCYKKVGMTENMKFRLRCLENTTHNREFDDIKEMTDYISQFIFMSVIDTLI